MSDAQGTTDPQAAETHDTVEIHKSGEPQPTGESPKTGNTQEATEPPKTIDETRKKSKKEVRMLELLSETLKTIQEKLDDSQETDSEEEFYGAHQLEKKLEKQLTINRQLEKQLELNRLVEQQREPENKDCVRELISGTLRTIKEKLNQTQETDSEEELDETQELEKKLEEQLKLSMKIEKQLGLNKKVGKQNNVDRKLYIIICKIEKLTKRVTDLETVNKRGVSRSNGYTNWKESHDALRSHLYVDFEDFMATFNFVIDRPTTESANRINRILSQGCKIDASLRFPRNGVYINVNVPLIHYYVNVVLGAIKSCAFDNGLKVCNWAVNDLFTDIKENKNNIHDEIHTLNSFEAKYKLKWTGFHFGIPKQNDFRYNAPYFGSFKQPIQEKAHFGGNFGLFGQNASVLGGNVGFGLNASTQGGGAVFGCQKPYSPASTQGKNSCFGSQPAFGQARTAFGPTQSVLPQPGFGQATSTHGLNDAFSSQNAFGQRGNNSLFGTASIQGFAQNNLQSVFPNNDDESFGNGNSFSFGASQHPATDTPQEHNGSFVVTESARNQENRLKFGVPPVTVQDSDGRASQSPFGQGNKIGLFGVPSTTTTPKNKLFGGSEGPNTRPKP